MSIQPGHLVGRWNEAGVGSSSSFGDVEDSRAEEAPDESSVGGKMAAVPVDAQTKPGECDLSESFSTFCRSSLSGKCYHLRGMHDIGDIASFFR